MEYAQSLTGMNKSSLSYLLESFARCVSSDQTLCLPFSGMESYCMRAFAEAMEVIPFTLAENAGLNPISVVTELRNRHAQGEKEAGINVRKVSRHCRVVPLGKGNMMLVCWLQGTITNILEENVVQPLLVSISAIALAAETVRSIMKIDDIVNAVR